MKLKDLIAIANGVYPDGLIQQYFEKPRKDHGDSLAAFIASELTSTLDQARSDAEQIRDAINAMERARDEIEKVIGALEGKLP